MLDEETTYLGVSCLTVRSNTERPVTISQGTNKLVSNSQKELIHAVCKVLNNGSNNSYAIPDLWEGKASEKNHKGY